MEVQLGASGDRCGRCGYPVGLGGDVRHSAFDPLQVFECRQCGSVLDIGGHRW